MKTGIKNLLFWLVVVVVLWGCTGAEERKAEHLDRAKAFYAQEKYAKARVELKNVLQIDPNSVEAYWLFANVKEKEEDYRQSFSALSKVIELAPNHEEARVKLAQIYVAIGNLEKANEMVAFLLNSNSSNSTARVLKAQIMAREGKIDEALKVVEAVFKEDISQANAARLIALLYARQGKWDRAESTLTSAADANPDHTGIRMTLADVLMNAKRYEDTEKILNEIIRLEPDQWIHRARLAELYTRLDRIDDAERVLRNAVKAASNDEQRILHLVNFLLQHRDAKLAEQELLKQIKQRPEKVSLQLVLGKLYESQSNWLAAQTTYEKIIALDDEHPQAIEAKNKLAALYLSRGNLVKSEEYIDQVLDRSPGDTVGLLNRGKLAFAKKDYVGAIADFRTVARDFPGSGEIVSLLAQAHMLNGEKELALSTLRSAVNANPRNGNVRFEYVKMLVAMGDHDAALKQVDEVLELAPRHLKAMRQKVALLALKKEWVKAEETVKKIQETYPDNPVGEYELGRIQAAKKEFKKAEKSFAIAHEKAPENRAAFEALLRTYLVKGEFDKAIDALKQRIKESPNDAGYYNGLAEVYLATKENLGEAEKALQKAIALNSALPRPYHNLAKYYRLEKNEKGELQAYRMGLKAIPDDIPLAMALASLLEKLGNIDDAIKEYDGILAKNPQHTIARNNLAALLTDYKDDDKSLSKALDLVVDFEKGQNPLFLDTVGWVYYKRGDTDKAIKIYERIVEENATLPVIQYHIGMVHFARGHQDKAKAYLARAVTDESKYKGIDEARATLALLE